MPQIQFAIETSTSRSKPLDAANVVNFFVEAQGKSAKSQAPLFGCPGLTQFAVAGDGPMRGAWNFNGVAYIVSGDTLYRIDSDGTATDVGGDEKISGTAPVGMSDNGFQLGIVNGVNGWMFSLDDGLVRITDTAFYPCDTITFIDGYFIFDRKGTNQWFISDLYDGLTYNGLDFATAEAQPGFVVGIRQNLQLLFIFCTGHIEIWYNSGGATFPFSRYPGGSSIPFGCASPYSLTKQDGAIFFLGSDKIFYRLQGNVPQRISTHPIETIIENDANLATAECFTYTTEGHKLVYLTFPQSRRTLCFDIATGVWHERDSIDESYEPYGRYRGRCALEIYERVLIGDAFTGDFGSLRWNVYTEYGAPIRGRLRSSHAHEDRLWIFCSRFELDVETGVGLTTGQGEDPQYMLRWSKDGARTWSKQQVWRGAGRIGEYLKRLRWMSMGQARQWTIEIEITDPVKRVIIAAHADYDVGLR